MSTPSSTPHIAIIGGGMGGFVLLLTLSAEAYQQQCTQPTGISQQFLDLGSVNVNSREVSVNRS